jgi:hypothetical protein
MTYIRANASIRSALRPNRIRSSITRSLFKSRTPYSLRMATIGRIRFD